MKHYRIGSVRSRLFPGELKLFGIIFRNLELKSFIKTKNCGIELLPQMMCNVFNFVLIISINLQRKASEYFCFLRIKVLK